MSSLAANTAAASLRALLANRRPQINEVLRRYGATQPRLFGSVARGDAGTNSDVDLAAAFDPQARMDLFRLVALERRIAEIGRAHV